MHHDSWRDYAPFVDELAARGVARTSLLVVPHWRDRPLAADAEMVAWLRRLAAAGHEVVLHGWRHRADAVRGGVVSRLVGNVYTAGEGEFHQLGYAEARRRLEAGRDELAAAGLPPAGFVAPAWLLSGPARRAVRDLGFPYTAYLHRFETPPAGERRYAPCLVFSLRSPWRKRASLAWNPLWYQLNARAALLRVAVHPIDLGDAAGRAAMLRLAAAAARRRRVTTYADLAAERAAGGCGEADAA